VTASLAWTVVTAVWAVTPAYLPNGAAVVVGGGTPMDGGRTWRGARLLGDGKTWRGFVGGALAGAGVALGQSAVRPAVSPALPAFPLPVVVALPPGAMVDDAAGSFVKRRTGRPRGAPVPVIYQFGFLVGALGLATLVAPAWTLATFTPPVLLVVAVLTPLLHRGTNVVAYVAGLKDEPW
jgi:CDP-2,3-bis-(O-geranylgeranyl)-sn-glycerol synthase